MDSKQLSEVLTDVFRNLTVRIQHNHNDSGSDTDVLAIAELGKSFVFDSKTGKFLGALDAPVGSEYEQTGQRNQGLRAEDVFGQQLMRNVLGQFMDSPELTPRRTAIALLPNQALLSKFGG